MPERPNLVSVYVGPETLAKLLPERGSAEAEDREVEAGVAERAGSHEGVGEWGEWRSRNRKALPREAKQVGKSPKA